MVRRGKKGEGVGERKLNPSVYVQTRAKVPHRKLLFPSHSSQGKVQLK